MLKKIKYWHLIAGLLVWAWVLVPIISRIQVGSVYWLSYICTLSFIVFVLVVALVVKIIDEA